MIHKLRDKRQIARRKQVVSTIIWVIVFLLLAVAGFFAWTGTLFTHLGIPIWKTESLVVKKIDSAGYMVRTKSSVFKENDELKPENADIKNAMIDYQILKSENSQLKELMGRLSSPSSFILGTILTKPNRSPYDTIIIDIGSDAGVAEGDEVFANAETPIGTVGTVYSNSSLVVLYSNPGQMTEAVLDGSNASVTLLGRGGGNFEMTVPLELSSEKGTMVVLPSSVSHVVAVIEQVISVPTDPIKKVILRSPINIQSLKWVQVKK